VRAAPDFSAEAAERVAGLLGTDPRRGLGAAEAARRLAAHGPNEPGVKQRVRWHQVLARQFGDALSVLLLVAALISVLVGERVDALAILAIVGANGVLGFAQEWRAERALAALARMLSPGCTVLRDGVARLIEASQLVPGDVVLLDAGDRVPADLRLCEAHELETDESALTGESVPVRKGAEPVAPGTALAERASIAWSGTSVTSGNGRGLVIATGRSTEFGRIAALTEQVERERTPLQRALAQFGRRLAALGLGVALAIAVCGALRGHDPLLMFMTGVSLAVAVVPEGLPAVVTLTLALGVRALVRRRALLRRLAAAETLGAATVICTDKTGTLTQNEMTAQRVWLAAGEIELGGVGYEPLGELRSADRRIEPGSRPDLQAALETALRCSRARVYCEDGRWLRAGDPTEAALVVAAQKAGLDPDAGVSVELELPFSSARRRMAVVVRGSDGAVVHVKGALETLLERCTRILDGACERPLDASARARVLAAHAGLASRGLRCLALARRALSDPTPGAAEDLERELVLLGVVGMLDPPRPEVPPAVARAQGAGLRVIMITGDAPDTARAIAAQIGLGQPQVVVGTELAALADEELAARLRAPLVLARAEPEHKLRVVELLQRDGEVVAMTGDGVNDAPALRRADIGVAMGVRGTDVAKGASDLVLLDDCFASIVAAIEEGRRQYDNIAKFVRYLLTSNAGEVAAILICVLLGAPLVLLPVQILWINLLTDGATALALGLEKAEPGVMSRPPRPPREPLLGRRAALGVAVIGLYIGSVTAALFLASSPHLPGELERARTLAFAGIVLIEKANAFGFRALYAPLWRLPFFSNPALLLAVAAMLALQVAAVELAPLQRLLHTVPLAPRDWLLLVALALPVIALGECVRRLGAGAQSRSGSESASKAAPARSSRR
jgi:Ca2+-transporting ATPase